MSPTRKKPHCTICGKPMAGHKRHLGVPICNSPPSPPATPPRPAHHTPSAHPSPPLSPPPRPSLPPHADLEELVIPKYGLWRRPNPHWPDPPRPRPTPPYAGSLVPTVLDADDDDGDGMKTEQDDDDCDAHTAASGTSRSSGALIEHALGGSAPLASVFCTPAADVRRVRAAADTVGLHHGALKAGADWWVVLGASAAAVEHLLALERRRMPGVFMRTPQEDVVKDAPSGLWGLFQMVVAGAVGGLVVARVSGLSLL